MNLIDNMRTVAKIPLSIAIVTWNRSRQLAKSIESCIACNLPENTEFIIIDNASTDDTEKSVFSIFEKHDYHFYYERMANNLGAGEGRNVAFSECNGKYVYFMDDDAYIDAEKDPDFFIKGIYILDSHMDVMTLTTQIYDLAWKANRLPDYAPKIDDSLCKCYMVCGGSHFLRRSFFEGTNPYFPNKYGYEELKPSLRVADAGYINAYSPNLRVIHNPAVNKWQFKETSNTGILINEVANQFAIKTSVYPRLAYPICLLAYLIRQKRHLPHSELVRCNHVARELKKTYYFGPRIRLRTIVSMYRDFGFKVF